MYQDMEKQISVVIPVLNEEESLRELYERVLDGLEKIGKSYEIIFIDDGSKDKSLDIIKSLASKNKDIKVFSFRKNLGKSYAYMVGFNKASGKFVVTLDADLQDDPKSIKILYDKFVRGKYDLVAGWRKARRDNITKRLSSKLFNNIVSSIFGFKIHDLNCGLKIYRNEVAKDLRLYGGMHRFIPIFVNEMGYKVGETEIIHFPRKYGKSKYKATKIITDLPDLITVFFLTRYTRRPLHFFGKIGSVLVFIGFIILIYLSYIHFLGESIGRRPLLFLGILLIILGIQIIFTGLLADLIVNTNTKDDKNFPLKYESKLNN